MNVVVVAMGASAATIVFMQRRISQSLPPIGLIPYSTISMEASIIHRRPWRQPAAEAEFTLAHRADDDENTAMEDRCNPLENISSFERSM